MLLSGCTRGLDYRNKESTLHTFLIVLFLVVGSTDLTPQQINSILAQAVAEPDGTLCEKFDPSQACRKDKGEGKRGYSYSRGYVFGVRASGFIECVAPIYR